jgi:hypothetical protein
VLDDRDRRALSEIQRGFLADDPRFVQTFDTRAQRLPDMAAATPTDQRWLTYTALIWIVAPIGVLLLAVGSLGSAMFLLSATAALVFARGPRDGTVERR